MSQPPNDPAWHQQPGPEPSVDPPTQTYGSLQPPPAQPQQYQPYQPYQPPAQPYQPPAQPYQPPAQPYQPPAQPYEPPVQPPAQPYQPPPQPAYPQAGYDPFQQPGYVPPGGGYPPPAAPGWAPGGTPPGRNGNGKLIGIIVAAVLVVAIGVTLAIVLTGKKKTPVANPTTSHGSVTSPSFPSSSVPSTPEGPTADQTQIATNATTFIHALAADNPAVFCPLWDPTDLQKVMTEKSITACTNIELTSAAGKAEDAQFAISDPTGIEVDGSTATIPASVVTPADVAPVTMVKDTDGTWKCAFSE